MFLQQPHLSSYSKGSGDNDYKHQEAAGSIAEAIMFFSGGEETKWYSSRCL